MKNSQKKLIIFDFDGTIANTWEVIITIINERAEKLGLPEIVPEDHQTLRDKSLRELASHFGISKLKIPFLFKAVQNQLKKRVGELEPISGMPALLKKIDKNKYHLAILTTNLSPTVTTFLKDHSLTMFDSIHSIQRGRGKARTIKRLLKKYHVSAKDTVHVGDTVNDIVVAHKSHVAAVSVTWGLNSRRSLEKHNPLFIVETPEELLKVLVD